MVMQTPANQEYSVCCLNSLLLSGGLLLPAESPHRSLPIWGQGSRAMKFLLPALQLCLLSFPEITVSDTSPTKWAHQHCLVRIAFINKLEIIFHGISQNIMSYTALPAAA